MARASDLSPKARDGSWIFEIPNTILEMMIDDVREFAQRKNI
jgi:hypothetical protein